MKNDTVDLSSVNLVTAITDLLAKSGHPRPTNWQVGLNPDALITSDQNIQRFLINRQWRLILSNAPNVNTMDQRYCLVDQGDIKDWYRLFEVEVLPCILNNQLAL